MKGKIYEACVQSDVVYGSNTWPMKSRDLSRLVRTERMMPRRMCGVNLNDMKSSADLLNYLGVVSVAEVVQRGRLRWFGHVERMSADVWVSACRNLEISGNKGRGRSRKTSKGCVSDDMKLLKLTRDDAQYRVAWRSTIMGRCPTLVNMEQRT